MGKVQNWAIIVQFATGGQVRRTRASERTKEAGGRTGVYKERQKLRTRIEEQGRRDETQMDLEETDWTAAT